MIPQSSTFTPKIESAQSYPCDAAPTFLPTPPTLPRGRKRGQKQQDPINIVDDWTGETKRQKQQRATHGVRATKPLFRKPVKENNATTPPSFNAIAIVSTSIPASANNHSHVPTGMAQSENVSSQQFAHHQLKPKAAISLTRSIVRHPTQNSSQTIPSATASVGADLDVEAVHSSDFSSQDLVTDDEIEHIFAMIDASDSTNSGTSESELVPKVENLHYREAGPNAYYQPSMVDDDFTDDDLFSLTKGRACNYNSPPQSETKAQESAGSHQLNARMSSRLPEDNCPRTPQKCARKFTSPLTERSINLAGNSVAKSDKVRTPIVRPPFPIPVRDRSPIIGLSPNLLLRTCFRIGEAINQASQATSRGQKLLFELYARVHTSKRNETRQEFVFRDLFHEKPPYMKGVYDAVIWKSVQLYSYDSERLLEAQRICRCIGTIKRDGKEWVMVVLNAWEARWEDIAWVEGIIKV